MRMVSPRYLWALFQVLITFVVTDFFLYKLAQKESLNISCGEWGFFIVINIGAKSELIVEVWCQETINKFTDQKNIFKKDFIHEFK